MVGIPSRAAGHRIPHTAICAALLLALPHVAKAARLNYDIGLGVMHSDNITLTEANPVSEEVLSPRLRFDFAHESTALKTEIRGDLQYLDYVDDVYDDDTRGELVGALDWTVIPERMHFIAADSLSRQSVSNLVAFTPGNQQQINVFEAGPSFYGRFGNTMRGQLDLRYINSYAEETETFNSDRYNVAARLLRDLNGTDQLSFNLEGTQTNYDTISELYDYKRYDAYVNYKSVLNIITIDMDLGYSDLQPRTGDSQSSMLVRANLDWRATPRGLFSAELSYQFADATQDLILRVDDPTLPINPGIGDPDNPNLQIVPDIFKQKRANLGYEFTGDRLYLLIQPYYEQLRYVRDSSFDQDNYGGRVSGRYQLRSLMFLTFQASRQEREFLGIDRDDQDTTLGTGVEARFSRHWGTQFDYQYRKRNSSIGGQNYTENVVAISFTYFR